MRQAWLQCDSIDIPEVAFCLGSWAGSLHELALWSWEDADPFPTSLDFLGGLQQVTLLELKDLPLMDASQLRWLTRLGRLRTLTLRVSTDFEGAQGQLPLPPRLQYMPRANLQGEWQLPAQLLAMAGLQTLALEALPPEAGAPSLGELAGLTALELDTCVIDVPLLSGRSRCTGLRLLGLFAAPSWEPRLMVQRHWAGRCGSCRASRPCGCIIATWPPFRRRGC